MTRRAAASRASVTRALALTLAFSALAGLVPVLLHAAPAFADDEVQPADPVAEATRIRDEAKVLFRQAGDPDADQGERAKNRKDCFRKLKQARKILDVFLKAHPDLADKYDELYCDISSMLFWTKKELTLDDIRELEGHGPAPAPAPGPAPGPSGPGPEPGPGAPPPGPTPPGPSPGPTPGPPPSVPPAAPPVEPPKPRTAADELGDVVAYASEHPGDVPGLYERYAAFLDKFQDPSTPEYAKAAAALKALDDRMKDVYRTARDEDPESVRSEDPAETAKRLKQLLADLAASDDAVRTRAARFLGYLGSAEAVPPLLEALRGAPEGPFRDACAQALADLGGRRVYEKLVKIAQKDSTLNAPVCDVLRRGLAKGGPAGRLAGDTLARLAQGLPPEMQASSIAALKGAGAPGALGLAYATATYAAEDDRAALIDHVATFKDPRTVTHLARFLLAGVQGRRQEQASAARDAIKAIGKPGVRYLIPALDEPNVKLWVGQTLRDITGMDKMKDDKRKTWEAWFRKNRKSLE